jgi:hypothetical protein
VNSAGTGESRLPFSFHSIASNDHHVVPSYPIYVDRHYLEENPDPHYAKENPGEANPEARLTEHQEDSEQPQNF